MKIHVGAIAVSIPAAILYYLWIKRKQTKIEPQGKLIFITGCDSGVGFSLAQHSVDLGFQVIAGCLSLDSEGAKILAEKYGSKIIIVQLDITQKKSVYQAWSFINSLIERLRENTTFYGLVNNAGVMTFGEFEWQTEDIIQHQILVNFFGTCLVTKIFCPLIRKHRGRIINITSHCSKEALPGLAVYSGTKTAILAWSNALRREMKKYGVTVTNLIPGSYPTQSAIMANNSRNLELMENAFSLEQRSFYRNYFAEYKQFINRIPKPTKVEKLNNDQLYKTFEKILFSNQPQFEYTTEPLRYKIYHAIFKYAPRSIADKAVEKFMHLPKYDEA